MALTSLANLPVLAVVALVAASLFNIGVYPLTVLVSVPGLRYWPGFIERQVGFLISSSIPGGGVFAVGAQYRILSYYRVSPARSAAAVSADAVWVYLFTLIMPAAAVLFVAMEGRQIAGYVTLAVVALVAVLISIFLIFIVLRSETGAVQVSRMAHRVADPFFHRFKKTPPDFETALLTFRHTAYELVTTRWKAITLTNALAQLAPLLVLVVALIGLGAYPGGELTLAEIFAAYSIAILLVSIPISPGGLGTVDLALVSLLKGFGAEAEIALAADLIWRLAWFLPQILAGVGSMIAFFFVQRRGKLHDPIESAPQT